MKMAELTPMMQQYMETKEKYKDCILFYRLGDFYEMFFEDAITASRELEITLTGKSCGLDERAPMCGVPYHAADTYINKLVSKGYKVAIGEQVEDPKLAKGIVKREVVRIVTPGTNLNMQALDETKNNYLMSIVYVGDNIGISIADVSTGDYYVTEVDSGRVLLDEINKFAPSEIICNDSFYMSGVEIDDLVNRMNIAVSALDSWYFDEDLCIRTLLSHFDLKSIDGLGLKDYPTGVVAAGALMQYLVETQKNSLSHITRLVPYSTGKYMIIDSSSRRNLELVETLREKRKRGSLLWVLDKTKTAMGARRLRNIIEQPLIEKEEIIKRQDAIFHLNNNAILREELREYLNPVYDFERIMSKITCKSVNPRDLIALRNSLEMLPHIKTLLSDFDSGLLHEINERMDDLNDIYHLINDAIDEEAPITIREGGLIKDGFYEEIDHLRQAKTDGKNWLMEFEMQEKEKTGIKISV